MRQLLLFIAVSATSMGLFGYTHTIKPDQTMKNTPGSYEIFLDERPETSFFLVIGKDQTISATNQRGVEVTITDDGYIQVTNTTNNAICLRKITINDTQKTLGSSSVETKPFRKTISGPSYCGDYTFKLTIEDGQLKLKDKTII